MGQYLPILLLLALAGLFAGLSLIASGLLNPRRETGPKISPYECGVVDQLPPPERFPVRFYLVAMIFIVFDIEIIFLYPFTMVYRELGAFGLGAVVIFGLAVFESFLYVLSNGALDWGPARQVRRTHDLAVSSDRTSRNTIRRVGTTGRAGEAPAQPDKHGIEAA